MYQSFDELLHLMDWINENRKGRGLMNDAKEFMRILMSKIAYDVESVSLIT